MVPVADWLRGPLRPWAEDLIASDAVRDGPLDARPIRDRWARHQAGEDWASPLWAVLMYLAWARRPIAPAQNTM